MLHVPVPEKSWMLIVPAERPKVPLTTRLSVGIAPTVAARLIVPPEFVMVPPLLIVTVTEERNVPLDWLNVPETDTAPAVAEIVPPD